MRVMLTDDENRENSGLAQKNNDRRSRERDAAATLDGVSPQGSGRPSDASGRKKCSVEEMIHGGPKRGASTPPGKGPCRLRDGLGSLLGRSKVGLLVSPPTLSTTVKTDRSTFLTAKSVLLVNCDRRIGHRLRYC
jgi:hypothetical protein